MQLVNKAGIQNNSVLIVKKTPTRTKATKHIVEVKGSAV
uniref:Uncharacterized protein n=1 Tax=Rhizophora mucronata TaxID=61149 RepID=A0A2P2R2E7_RHIMU